MWFVRAALLCTASTAFGQFVVEPSRVPKEWLDFGQQPGQAELDCRVSPMKPRLNYSFRFQTGYIAEVPGRQYRGKGHKLATFFRVTPENGSPVYFLSQAALPDMPETKATLEFAGGYVVGEGKYKVDWMLVDNSGRACMGDWKVNAKFGRKERDIEPGMAAGAADSISLRSWVRNARGPDATSGNRVTVLMNASPVMPRRIRLGGYDRLLLLSSLASLVERLPASSIRLVVFSMDQQREIYRDDDFETEDFDKVARALNALELGTVDYDVLKNRTGHIDLVADLIDESLQVGEADAVLFLGPKPHYFDKVKRSVLPERSADDPRFFYVQFRPYLASASFPDTLMSAVKQMGGKTFDVYSPGDFAEAIREISRALGEAGGKRTAALNSLPVRAN